MFRLPNTKYLLSVVLLLVSTTVLASGKKTEVCGVVEDFGGRLQIISPDRTVITEAAPKAALECGSWISTSKGWLRLRHRDGFRMQLGREGFFQVKAGVEGTEHGVLYRGEARLEGMPGSGQLRVLTANGRARVSRGPAILSFDPKQEQTQLISLGRSVSLENRFSSSRPITLSPGHFSSMNFKRLRVVPSAAAPMAIAGLKQAMANLQLSSADQAQALSAASSSSVRRGLASVAQKPGKQLKVKTPVRITERYSRHLPGPAKRDEQLREYLVRKTAAGSAAGEEILFPAQSPGRNPSSLIQVEPLTGRGEKPSKAQEAEKRKLIDELTRIRGE